MIKQAELQNIATSRRGRQMRRQLRDDIRPGLLKHAGMLDGIMRAGRTAKNYFKALGNPAKTNTGKFFSNIQKAYKNKGFSGALDEAAKHKQPASNLLEDVEDATDIPEMNQMRGTLGRGFRQALGNQAATLKGLGKDVSDDPKKIFSNIWETGKRQTRGSQYVEKEYVDDLADDLKTYTKQTDEGTEKFLKSDTGYDTLDKIMPDRKIYSDTGRGYVVKKRMPARIASPFITSPGGPTAAGSTFATNELMTDKSFGENLTESAVQGAMFLPGEIVGFGTLGARMATGI